ncbi:glycosyltransferase [Flavobacteriaceae bacterium F08102]|nr:glycosyltransferase [Flavobacteriaceae bacterium F08102]
MVSPLIYGLFIATVGIQLLYFFGFGYFFPSVKQWPLIPQKPISILIAAKNEYDQLRKNLPKILTQDYPTFEVIIIIDATTDRSKHLIEGFQKTYKNLHLVDIPKSQNYQGNKKNALRHGISKAQYKQLIFTDADCYPNSNQWLSHMISPMNSKKDIVLGYGAYEKTPSFLNKLIRYETLLTAMQYFAYAESGFPYMGVGRNLAFKKAVLGSNPYLSHQHLLSGDDDLMVNTLANANNTASMIAPKSFTYSAPEKTVRSWIKQKKRHYTTAASYKVVHKLALGLFFISQFLFWFLAIILLATSFNSFIVISLIIIRLGIQYVIFKKVAKKLKEIDLKRFLPILDFLLVTVQLYCGISNLISKPKNW